MPAAASIVIANGESSPVNHTFAPLQEDRATGTWFFEDQSPRVASASPMGWPRIGVSSKRGVNMQAGAKASEIVNRVTITIALPQLETLGNSDSGLLPSPTVAYADRVKIEFILPARDGLADRKDALAYAKNILANANVIDIVHNLTSFY